MTYEETYQVVSREAPKALPYFADAWNRFPVGHCAAFVIDDLRDAERFLKKVVKMSRLELVQGAIKAIDGHRNS